MRRWAGLALVAGMAGGCAQRPSDEECAALIERYTGKLLSANNPELRAADLAELQEEARAVAQHNPEVTRCRGKVSRRQYECAMNAPSADEIEKCLLP